MTPLSRWERTIVFDDALWHSAPPPLGLLWLFSPTGLIPSLCAAYKVVVSEGPGPFSRVSSGTRLASTVHMVSVRWLLLIPILLLGSCPQNVGNPYSDQTQAPSDETSIDAVFTPPSPETILRGPAW